LRYTKAETIKTQPIKREKSPIEQTITIPKTTPVPETAVTTTDIAMTEKPVEQNALQLLQENYIEDDTDLGS